MKRSVACGSLFTVLLLITLLTYAQTIRNTAGKVMPADAAPLTSQAYRFMIVEPTTLDANIAIYEAQSGIFPFEGLTRISPQQVLVPAAATRWEASKDGLSWTFHLRKGAKWSDGRPVTAQDFEYTFRRAIDPNSGNVYAFFYYPIKGAKAFNQGQSKDPKTIGIKALDDYTLRIDTEEPCPYLPHLTAFTGSAAVPRWQIEKYGVKWTEPGNVVSNSTFLLDKWRTGYSFEFVLNPTYDGPHKAYLERITGLFVGAESNAGYLAYENGEVDYQAVTSMDVPALRNHPVLKNELVLSTIFHTRFLFFDTQTPPFSDLRVRQAISHAIQRDALSRIVLQGMGMPAHSMLPPGYPGYENEALAPIQKYDPALGKKLLAEAGYPNGRGFPSQDFILRGPELKQAAEAIQQMLKSTLNITLNIKIMEPKAYSTAMYQWKLPISLGGFSSDYPDASNMLGMVWRSQPMGYGRQPWQNARFDQLIDQANVEMDPKKRAAMYRAANRILSEDVGAVFLFYQKEASLRKPWLKGFQKNTIGDTPFTNYFDIYIAKNKR